MEKKLHNSTTQILGTLLQILFQKKDLISVVPHPEDENLLNEKMASFTQLLLSYHFLNASYFCQKRADQPW